MFLNREDLYVKDSKTREKQIKVESKIRESLKLEKEKKIREEQEELNKRQKQLDEMSTNAVNSRKLERRRAIQERVEKQKKATQLFLVEKLNKIFFNSIPLTEEAKNKYENSIKAHGEAIIKEMFNQEILLPESFVAYDCYLSKEIYSYAKAFGEKFTEDTLFNGTMDEVLFEKTEDDEEEIEKVVKDKVKEVISKEKEIAKKNKEEFDDEEDEDDIEDIEGDEEEIEKPPVEDDDIEDEMDDEEEDDDEDDEDKKKKKKKDDDDDEVEVNIDVDIDTDGDDDKEPKDESFVGDYTFFYKKRTKPSLFRSIVINNSKKVLKEGVDEEMDMENIINESVVFYTLLETLNTMKLIKFTPNNVQDYCNLLVLK